MQPPAPHPRRVVHIEIARPTSWLGRLVLGLSVLVIVVFTMLFTIVIVVTLFALIASVIAASWWRRKRTVEGLERRP